MSELVLVNVINTIRAHEFYKNLPIPMCLGAFLAGGKDNMKEIYLDGKNMSEEVFYDQLKQCELVVKIYRELVSSNE